MNEELKNNNNQNNDSNSTVEILSEADSKKKILELARQQKEQFDKERLAWRKAKQSQEEKEMQLLIENGQIKKTLDNLQETVEALKYNAILEKEVSRVSQNKPTEVELTSEQKVNQILAEVIRERRIVAQEKRKQKKDNVFYM